MCPPVNLYMDPGFESGALRGTDERHVIGTDVSAIVTDPVISGQRSLRVGASGSSWSVGSEAVWFRRTFPAAVGSVWSASALAAYAGPTVRGRLTVFFTGPKEFTSGKAQTSIGQLTPVRLQVDGLVAPVATKTVTIQLSLITETAGKTPNAVVYFDDIVFVEAPEAPAAIDGDRGAMEWTGPRFTTSEPQPEAPQLGLQEGWAPPYLWEPPFYSEAEEQ